ncbi:MAG: DsbA family protein [Sulfuritalea sp.]|nr:DsbA family protein [Sulfuritalea sp.]MDP1981620.1 DsbA family protein [Sulfuritalea sp.]
MKSASRTGRLASHLLILGALCTGSAWAETPSQARARAQTEAVVRAYLLAHPEVVREALVALQQRETAAAAEASRRALTTHRDELTADPSSPVLGNLQGDVTVVEFFDYRCGYCKRVSPAVSALLAADPKVRLVLKELPILGPDSLLAAKSALAAHKQGRYADFHKGLLESPAVDAEAIDALAVSLGLDMDRFKADRDDAATVAALEKNHRLANALGIGGTPAFVIGDRLVPGAADAQTLIGLVGAARRATSN